LCKDDDFRIHIGNAPPSELAEKNLVFHSLGYISMFYVGIIEGPAKDPPIQKKARGW